MATTTANPICDVPPQAQPQPLLEAASPTKLNDLHLQLVTKRHDSHLHNELIERYHYLGYQPLAGAQLRYFVCANARIVALLCFAAAAWKTQPRDRFIGWTPEQRQQQLHLVVNNARFLIRPGCDAQTSPPPSSPEPLDGCHRIGNCTMATVPSCSRPLSSCPASKAPVTERQIGPCSQTPKAAESSVPTTRPGSRKRPSGSTQSPTTSGSSSASIESLTRSPSRVISVNPTARSQDLERSLCPDLLRSYHGHHLKRRQIQDLLSRSAG